MENLICSPEEEATFSKWLDYLEKCREREFSYVAKLSLDCKEVELAQWQRMSLQSCMFNFYLKHVRDDLCPKFGNHIEALSDGHFIYKVMHCICPKHRRKHRFWLKLSAHIKPEEVDKPGKRWSVVCYAPNKMGFV